MSIDQLNSRCSCRNTIQSNLNGLKYLGKYLSIELGRIRETVARISFRRRIPNSFSRPTRTTTKFRLSKFRKIDLGEIGKFMMCVSSNERPMIRNESRAHNRKELRARKPPKQACSQLASQSASQPTSYSSKLRGCRPPARPSARSLVPSSVPPSNNF